MSAPRIDVADLLRHAGARRPVRLEVTLPDLAVGAVRVVGPIELDLVLERVPEGVVALGTMRAAWETECSNCLTPLTSSVEVGVRELFEAYPVEGETYPILGHEIDLEQLLRDAVLLELPLAPNCASTGRADCHDTAGADDDLASDDAPDPRWAVLSQLEL